MPHLPLMNRNPKGIRDVVESQLCCGCGACAYMAPQQIRMVDSLDHGRRPIVGVGLTDSDVDEGALAVCPGAGVGHDRGRDDRGVIRELRAGWGPVLEVWEGFATDPDIRFAGSSGGAATAIALACIERGGMHGVLHIRSRPDAPILNTTVLSTSRRDLIAATGSRYAPASPCDGLQRMEDAPGPSVFIGKPCDVAAAHRACRLRPGLSDKLGVSIAIFCAGTPTTSTTMTLLRRLGVEDPGDVLSIRYRGNGWPGDTVVTLRTAHGITTRSITYDEAWGQVLANGKQWRCYVCPDHTGELADIAVGDPWYRPIEPGEPGRSLILVRTDRGRRVLRDAIDNGYVEASPADPSVLPASQGNLLRARGSVFGRLIVCRVLGVPAPRFGGMPMLRFWVTQLTLGQKFRSVAGTARHIVKRGLRGRSMVLPDDGPIRRLVDDREAVRTGHESGTAQERRAA